MSGLAAFLFPKQEKGLLAQETCLHYQATGGVMESNHSDPDKSTFALSKLSVRVERV